MIYSFWLFDRHCDCIFSRLWNKEQQLAPSADTAKLIYGIVVSLRNVARKVGNDDSFSTYSTSLYKLHYYESPSNLKLVLITDLASSSRVSALEQIYSTLYLEYVVKNPLSPVEHSNGAGVDNEFFVLGLDAFVTGLVGFA